MLKRILSLGFAALALAVIAPAIGSLTGVGEGVAQAQTPPAPRSARRTRRSGGP